MTRSMHDPPLTDRTRLLGGWRDIQDDVGRLARQIERLPASGCACTDHAPGAVCPCCAAARRALDQACPSCEALVHDLDTRFADLQDHMVRYLPAVRATTDRAEAPLVTVQIEALQQQVATLLRLFGRIRAGADAFTGGCQGAHLMTLRTLVPHLVETARALDRTLTRA